MGVTLCHLPEDCLCFLDNNGDKLIMKLYEKNARILKTDINKELVLAAEQIAFQAGKTMLCCDFPSDEESTEKVLSECGFTMSQGKDIISVKASELFYSKGVQKSMQVDFPKLEFYPFRDLLLYQVEQLQHYLSKNHVILSQREITEFDNDLSGVVYNESLMPQAVILVSEYGKEIMIEFLFGIVKDKPLNVMAALQGFATEFMNHRFLEIYDTIAMLKVKETIVPLLKRLLDKEYDLKKEGYTLEAKKALSADSVSSDVSITEDNTAANISVMKEIVHYQHNINWKLQWDFDEK